MSSDNSEIQKLIILIEEQKNKLDKLEMTFQ